MGSGYQEREELSPEARHGNIKRAEGDVGLCLRLMFGKTHLVRGANGAISLIYDMHMWLALLSFSADPKTLIPFGRKAQRGAGFRGTHASLVSLPLLPSRSR